MNPLSCSVPLILFSAVFKSTGSSLSRAIRNRYLVEIQAETDAIVMTPAAAPAAFDIVLSLMSFIYTTSTLPCTVSPANVFILLHHHIMFIQAQVQTKKYPMSDFDTGYSLRELQNACRRKLFYFTPADNILHMSLLQLADPPGLFSDSLLQLADPPGLFSDIAFHVIFQPVKRPAQKDAAVVCMKIFPVFLRDMMSGQDCIQVLFCNAVTNPSCG